MKEAWDHGTFEEFYKKLKDGKLQNIKFYNGYIDYLDKNNYMNYIGPTVLGDGVHDNTVYDVVYLSGTKAILCMHNCSSDYQTWSAAKSAASSYRSGGYLPSLAQVGKWYCNNSNITNDGTQYTQLIKHREGSGSAYFWWTSTQYISSLAYYILYCGRIGS